MALTMTTKADREQLDAADRLRRAIKASGKTREQISRESGIDVSTISRLLGGKRRIRIDTVECLAPVLGVDVKQLLSGDVATSVRPAPTELPEGLAHYLEGRETRIAPAIVQAMKCSQFQAIPGVIFDDIFWDEQRQLWEKRLGLQPLRPLDQRGPGTGS